jgi:hypothetical protein
MIPDIPDSTTPRVPPTVFGGLPRLSHADVLTLSAYATKKYRSLGPTLVQRDTRGPGKQLALLRIQRNGGGTLGWKAGAACSGKRSGISDIAVERSEMCVSIPMFGMIESLNLGTSSAIVLYEVAKQRRDYQSRYRLRGRRMSAQGLYRL